jgi:hypothetical protein
MIRWPRDEEGRYYNPTLIRSIAFLSDESAQVDIQDGPTIDITDDGYILDLIDLAAGDPIGSTRKASEKSEED